MPKHLRMAHKLWLAVILIVVMLVAVGFAAYRSAKVQANADAVSKDMESRVQAALRWSGLTETNAARTQALIVSSDPAVEAEFKDVITATSAQISEVQKSLESMALSEADKQQMAKIAAARKTMIDLRGEARKLKSDGQQEQAVTLITQKYNPSVAAYTTTLREFVQQQQLGAEAVQKQMAAERMLTVKIAAVAVGLLLLAIIVGAYYLIGSIQRPLEEANGLAERIAGGDLSMQESVTRGDEFGDLLRSLYAMSSALGRMVHQVRQSTDSIAIASAEIATGNHDLSARTEQTSSNLQETAAAMEDINHSSKKIADIIGVIDGIAFQTNILALNAAVEAARAGEQGRGFAVVASEVRSLAQRSAEAAKEIKLLISASVEKVETGSRLVSDAGTTMTDIVQSVQRVTDMIGEITAASSEQSAGVSQVNKAISNLDQMTQQNAALVEESAAAAQSLREQADPLAREVSMFKVNAASYGPAQAAIGAARATAAQRPQAPARPAPGSGAKALHGTPTAVAKATAAAAAVAKVSAAPAPASRKPAVAQGSEEDWESF